MIPGPCLLLIGGDALTRQALAASLATAGPFNVVAVAQAEEAPSALADHRPAVIVIEATPDDPQGDATVHTLQRHGLTAPSLRLVNRAGEGRGAETLEKPFRLHDLVARLKALCHAEPVLPLGTSVFRPERKILETPTGPWPGHLTDKEAQLLAVLAGTPGQIVPRETLLTKVWGYSDTLDTHTLETHVYRLRRKLEADPLPGLALVTEEGGYRLCIERPS